MQTRDRWCPNMYYDWLWLDGYRVSVSIDVMAWYSSDMKSHWLDTWETFDYDNDKDNDSLECLTMKTSGLKTSHATPRLVAISIIFDV